MGYGFVVGGVWGGLCSGLIMGLFDTSGVGGGDDFARFDAGME